MINKRFYLHIDVDAHNRYIIDGDPRNDYIVLSRQKRDHVSHGWTVLNAIQLPVTGAAATLAIAETIIDAVNLVGVLREDNQEWLDKFNADVYDKDNKVRFSDAPVTFMEF